MTPFGVVRARAAVVDRANVDTDQIIPARFLRKPRGGGYGEYLFHDLPEVRAAVMGAGVLVAGENFGCGSSREGAVYALVDAGIRCVLAPSFGDIFAGNAGKNGLLLLTPSGGELAALRGAVGGGADVVVDLPGQRVEGAGVAFGFEIEAFRKRGLVEGLDDIGETLGYLGALRAWGERDLAARPWVVPG